jgi:hypothetical protein
MQIQLTLSPAAAATLENVTVVPLVCVTVMLFALVASVAVQV